MTIETLRKEISILQQELTRTSFELKMEKRLHRAMELLMARMEIYKSICHRQGMIIEIQSNIIKFEEGKVA